MNEYGMPQFMGFMRGHPALLMPDRGAGAGGGKGRPAKPVKPAKSAAKPARGREPPSRTPPDDEEDIEAEEEEDIEDEEDIEAGDEDEDEEDTEDEEDEEDEETEENRNKSKGDDGKKKPKPKMIRVPADKWQKLRDQQRAAEDADRKAARARDRAAREREEKIAAKDAQKGLELARKRLQREIDRRDTELESLRQNNERLTGHLGGLAIQSGLRDAIDTVLGERGQELRKGAFAHIRKAIAGQFEVIQGDDDDEPAIVHKETGDTLEDFLTSAFDTDEYALFLKDGDSDSGRREKPAGSKGTNKAPAENRARREKPDKRPSYAEAYNLRVKELQEMEGVKPAIGLRRVVKES